MAYDNLKFGERGVIFFAFSFQHERGPEFEVCGDGGDVFSTCDGDGDDSALRLVHFTWAKPYGRWWVSTT
jgi:hypothetical protein